MPKLEVLFFSADPKSAPPHGRSPRLLLDEDMRRIQEKVRAARHRDAIRFEWRPAARPDDLIQALNEVKPQVVHFSGHGGSEGLVLVGEDGLPQRVGAAALTHLFRVFRGDIRLVVLNACFSVAQARAIADCVGCAIGTRGEISDGAAITFGASLYRAIAFGHSVQAAFDQARASLALEHIAEADCPELLCADNIDPEKLFLIPAAETIAPERPAAAQQPSADAPAPAPPMAALAMAVAAPAPASDSAPEALAAYHHLPPAVAEDSDQGDEEPRGVSDAILPLGGFGAVESDPLATEVSEAGWPAAYPAAVVMASSAMAVVLARDAAHLLALVSAPVAVAIVLWLFLQTNPRPLFRPMAAAAALGVSALMVVGVAKALDLPGTDTLADAADASLP
jgi:CHAT domain